MTFHQRARRIRAIVKSRLRPTDARKQLTFPQIWYLDVDRQILDRLETEPMRDKDRNMWLDVAEWQIRLADEQTLALQSALRA